MNTPDLHIIAAQLEGLEETIISKLIERAQFCANPAVYETGTSGFEGADRESLFDLRLRYQEEMDARFGRFCVPEERPFTKKLPPPGRKVTLPPTCIAIDDYDQVNISARIRVAYLNMIPTLCAGGDDGQHGSSVEHDVYAFQAIARRIHYGALYVAESKYQNDPERYRELVCKLDRDALLQLLTRREVEEKILRRVKEKVDRLQAEINRKIRKVVDPETVLKFYRDSVIPLTKEGEVLYLLNRREELA